jgi:hypothetical protein
MAVPNPDQLGLVTMFLPDNLPIKDDCALSASDIVTSGLIKSHRHAFWACSDSPLLASSSDINRQSV